MRLGKGLALGIALWTNVALAGNLHSKITVSAVQNSDHTMTLVFKAVPDACCKITTEAPWKLTITGSKGLGLGKDDGEFVMPKLDEKLPGFQVTSGKIVGQHAEGKFAYTVKAFVCTLDKTNCYPEVHKGEFAWQFHAK